jgi:D-cysteine desulfhydrase
VKVESRCAEFSLLQRFPALVDLPRARLGAFPSPVARVETDIETDTGVLWIKRDDLNAATCGGNKVRALEYLLGAVGKNETILTAGGDGSTHVLATAIHGARLGAETVAVRWRQEMHPVADAVARRSTAACARTIRTQTVPGAFFRLALLRATNPHYRYIAPGGATPLGTLGHVNAGLELADQVAAGDLPEPSAVVVPLGTGATAAGLALGLGIARLSTRVIAVRVVPRVAFPGRRLHHLVAATRRLLADRAGVPAASLPAAPVDLDHSAFAGAYGRPLPNASSIPGLSLDATYSAKAATVATRYTRTTGAPVLFWLTFDARCL